MDRLYWPASRPGKTNVPAMSVLVLRARPVAVYVSETSAAAIARPLESCTAPEIELVTICANKPLANSKNKDASATGHNNMVPP